MIVRPVSDFRGMTNCVTLGSVCAGMTTERKEVGPQLLRHRSMIIESESGPTIFLCWHTPCSYDWHTKREEAPMRNAIAYVRVSTGKQRDEGISVDMQIARIRAYALIHDMTVVAVYGDAVSAKSIRHRPGMQAVLTLAQSKEIACVLVFKLDRAFRNTVEALQTAKTLDKAGVALHSLSENLDTKSAIGEFTYTLMASLAQMERKTIAERTRAVMQHLKSEGRYTGGRATYGYSVDPDGRLIENPEEQAVIGTIRALRADGVSIRRIIQALNELGMRSRQGTPFQIAQVQRIVKTLAT